MRALLPVLPLAILLCSPGVSAAQGDSSLSWRGVWEWSMPKKTPEDMTRIADTCDRLGFNVLMASPPQTLARCLHQECHQRGIKLYRSTVFTGGDKDWRQVLLPEQQARFERPRLQTFQQGGEPFTPDELFSGHLPCFNRPRVREHFARMVAEYARGEVDGLAFDMVGYVNYRRCHCDLCDEDFAKRRLADPGLTQDAWAEHVLMDFINEMAAVARETRPDIELSIHIYPYFAPNPYYGHRLDIDYVGETVAWFFRPHWPLEKVHRLVEDVVGKQGTAFSRQQAAPFIGFYSDPHRDFRSSTRVRKEIEAILAGGASAIQFAELGNLARKPAVASTVAAMLRTPNGTANDGLTDGVTD